MRSENITGKILGISLFLILCLGGCTPRSNPNMMDDSLQPTNLTALNFSDIEIPPEMKYKSMDSMMIKNNSFSGGIFFYSGKVGGDSLKDFIRLSMNNHKWKFSGENTMSKDSVLAYTKANKTCMYIIEEELTKTNLTVVITANNSSGRMPKFNESFN
ncbi:MAG: hypothetical protein CSB24_02845 [Deltaproteobacteria bacterium]|nr:MAG: hypothetical protein CSB24_02845 [Deltaproteobacteria bacterium]